MGLQLRPTRSGHLEEPLGSSALADGADHDPRVRQARSSGLTRGLRRRAPVRRRSAFCAPTQSPGRLTQTFSPLWIAKGQHLAERVGQRWHHLAWERLGDLIENTQVREGWGIVSE